MTVRGYAWVLQEQGKPLVRVERSWEEPPEGFALVEVLGCGVCHTDLGFADGPVRPKQALPITLGHEIAGVVLASRREGLTHRRVLAPAVSPCGTCATCARGRATACPAGRMPGNDGDGGFATHVLVPDRDLCVLDAEPGRRGLLGTARLEPWELAPIADAGTTAWQAIVRAGLRRDEVAVFVGSGGVGGFGVQLARAAGARVIAVDVDRGRLDAIAPMAHAVIDAGGKDARLVREAVRGEIKARGWKGATVRVFECSGTPAGQTAAFELLERGGSLSIVGFTPERVSLRLSNVMALDADVHGNWGCDPALYDRVLAWVLDGTVQVRPFVERHSLEDANAVLTAMRAHELRHRAVLAP